MPKAETVAAGLSRYLARVAALDGVVRPSPSPIGLRRFLELAGPFLSRAAPKPAQKPHRPPIEPHRLQNALVTLSGPLESARRNGAFLNVWSVAKLRRDELRHAAVLAWFLNPRGSHGLGDEPLRAFLDVVAKRNPDWPDLGQDVSRATVRTEEWPLGSETDRVDIAIDGSDFVIFVEVKIDAPEGPGQLQRYVTSAHGKAKVLRRKYGRVIYLSRRTARLDLPELASISWTDVARSLLELRRKGAGGSLAVQFAHHLRSLS